MVFGPIGESTVRCSQLAKNNEVLQRLGDTGTFPPHIQNHNSKTITYIHAHCWSPKKPKSTTKKQVKSVIHFVSMSRSIWFSLLVMKEKQEIFAVIFVRCTGGNCILVNTLLEKNLQQFKIPWIFVDEAELKSYTVDMSLSPHQQILVFLEI